jgi:uncharacterized protein YegP (UPF0339 family)
MGTFELFRSNANQDYYFRFKSGGNQLLSSEGYTTKSGCQNGIESVKKNAPFDNRYDRKDSTEHYTFNLKAANGEIIARSTKIYKMRSEREAAIEIVKREAPDAPVVDLT